ncbi:MAG: hypothetical protein PSV13_20230, partial [Lacunisphaera sp.]|nr:hypothetical protein [Lacunisphaera sp.]
PVGLQADRAKEIAVLIDTIVREDAITVHGFGTGLTPAGVDFGSASFVVLDRPAVALVTGDGVDPQVIGAAWHVLDQRVGLTPTLLDQAVMNRTELARYTVIVLADGTYDTLNDNTVAALKRWVRAGGTLVVQGRAVEWAAKKEIAAFEFGPKLEETPAKAAAGQPAPRRPYGEGADHEATKLVAGTIFEVAIDRTHPLGYGFNRDTLSVIRTSTAVLKPAKSPYETPAVYTAQPLQAGYTSPENLARIANSAAIVALPTGRGAVIALPDDPNFRGFWYGGNRVFFNAVFFGKAIRPIRTGDGGE